MRPHAPPPLLLLLLAAAALAGEPATTATLTDDARPLDGTTTLSANNDTAVDETQPLLNRTVVLDDATNETLAETDDDHEPVIRKKRTFGDLVFRGLADVLGYNVARKPAQNAFPPPLPPVPGIDTPLQAAPAPAPAPAPAQVPPPCGAPRAVGPPPCRAQLPPPPPPPPPCPKPRAAPTPRPPPPPPPPPPCGNGRANPTTPSPCGPAPPPPPPPKDNLERISSNFRLDFNFLRSTPAPQGAAVEAQQQQLAETPVAAVAPVAIQPRAAKLPLEEPRNPRVYVDAFVVRNGVAQRVNTVDARRLDPQRAPLEDDYLAYDDEAEALAQNLDDEDDYEDAQESQDRAKAVKDFSVAVDNFWDAKVKQGQKKQPALNYKNVHFGDRDLVNQIRRSGKQDSHQSLQRTRPKANRIPQPQPEAPEDDAEVTTTTEDPRRPLKPRVLPPTEQNPGEIDTVTVRVPPIYKEKRPKKLHRERPEEDRQDHDRSDHDEHHHNRPHYERSDRGRPDRDYDRSGEVNQSGERNYYYQENDTNGEDSSNYPQTEKPVRRKRRRKVSRKTRSTKEKDPFTAGDYDYYGQKLPISDEEKYFRGLTVPEPTKDADLARLEKAPEGREDYFLDDHERLREDPERIIDDDRLADDEGRADESGRLVDARDELSESERIVDEEKSDESERAGNEERSGEGERSDERERTDRLSPNARVHETGYSNNFVHATNVQVESPTPSVATIKKKSVKIGS